MKERVRRAMVSPYRFFAAAAVLAVLFSFLPTQADAPEKQTRLSEEKGVAEGKTAMSSDRVDGVPTGADLSEKTQAGAYLHSTLQYTCGHSVQRREELPTALVGLTRAALSMQAERTIPGIRITGFDAQEVDAARKMNIPCPLHWVLKLGESGRLEVLQNMNGEELVVVRETEINRELLSDDACQELLEGVVFDDTQALEGYVESLNS